MSVICCPGTAAQDLSPTQKSGPCEVRCSATEYQISNKTSLLALGSELNLKNVVLMERTAGDPIK